MCGELDESAQIGQDLVERLKVMSGMLGVSGGEAATGAPSGLAEASGRAAYMQSLFNAGLSRALADSAAVEPEEAVDAIASQAIAFARLAGFLAGQLPPEADLIRPVMEALLAGHAETGKLARDYRHRQDHLHGHSHDHDHHH